MGITDGEKDTDMMLIINIAWENSFTRVKKNKQDIVDTGWNPLNCALLLDDEIYSTIMTKKQKPMEFLLENNIIFPSNKTKCAHSSSDPSVSTTQNNSVTQLLKMKNMYQ